MKRMAILALAAAVCAAALAFADEGVRQRTPRPHEYGNVVINNASERNNIAPVVFNHWLHRAIYTCRVCHVDLGFGMSAGSTGITEEDNVNGLYCGACHNGKDAFGPVEKDQTGNQSKNCYLCHSSGRTVKFERNFYDYTKNYPKARYGNKVDWLAAEEKGTVKLKDYVEGHSFSTRKLEQSKDIDIKSKELGIEDIIFSHKKHIVWNGCELCHPDVFGVKKGTTQYTMQDIFEGRFCGSCHGIVAFPNTDCMLCHTKQVY